MSINFIAPVRPTLGFLPHMLDRQWHVANVVTAGVQLKSPKFAAYIASKTALDTFGRIARRELYGTGVMFTNVRLPLVRTDMNPAD